jgi:hypothetical protein
VPFQTISLMFIRMRFMMQQPHEPVRLLHGVFMAPA